MAVLRLVYSWSTCMAGVSNVSSVYYSSPIFSSTQISVLGWLQLAHTQETWCAWYPFSSVLSACSLSPTFTIVTQSIHLYFLFPFMLVFQDSLTCKGFLVVGCPLLLHVVWKNARLEVLCLSVQDAISPSADWSKLSCFLLFYCFFYCFLCFFHDFLQII